MTSWTDLGLKGLGTIILNQFTMFTEHSTKFLQYQRYNILVFEKCIGPRKSQAESQV